MQRAVSSLSSASLTNLVPRSITACVDWIEDKPKEMKRKRLLQPMKLLRAKDARAAAAIQSKLHDPVQARTTLRSVKNGKLVAAALLLELKMRHAPFLSAEQADRLASEVQRRTGAPSAANPSPTFDMVSVHMIFGELQDQRYATIRYLTQFLWRLHQHAKKNALPAPALAVIAADIVFAPDQADRCAEAYSFCIMHFQKLFHTPLPALVNAASASASSLLRHAVSSTSVSKSVQFDREIDAPEPESDGDDGDDDVDAGSDRKVEVIPIRAYNAAPDEPGLVDFTSMLCRATSASALSVGVSSTARLLAARLDTEFADRPALTASLSSTSVLQPSRQRASHLVPHRATHSLPLLPHSATATVHRAPLPPALPPSYAPGELPLPASQVAPRSAAACVSLTGYWYRGAVPQHRQMSPRAASLRAPALAPSSSAPVLSPTAPAPRFSSAASVTARIATPAARRASAPAKEDHLDATAPLFRAAVSELVSTSDTTRTLLSASAAELEAAERELCAREAELADLKGQLAFAKTLAGAGSDDDRRVQVLTREIQELRQANAQLQKIASGMQPQMQRRAVGTEARPMRRH